MLSPRHLVILTRLMTGIGIAQGVFIAHGFLTRDWPGRGPPEVAVITAVLFCGAAQIVPALGVFFCFAPHGLWSRPRKVAWVLWAIAAVPATALGTVASLVTLSRPRL